MEINRLVGIYTGAGTKLTCLINPANLGFLLSLVHEKIWLMSGLIGEGRSAGPAACKLHGLHAARRLGWMHAHLISASCRAQQHTNPPRRHPSTCANSYLARYIFDALSRSSTPPNIAQLATKFPSFQVPTREQQASTVTPACATST
jgi:hypothetical protein